ncbi:glycerol-3-phosphate cytidylyltransferase [Barrientosiimonas marina]|uniref:Glycerol-3-phosphate cytidylyltransferase n=1 Tax=Lentibacillus kimchii TaxID=1542911 RepID=A0ABW2UYH0_9BACI
MKKVITYGTFDLLHVGHINILRRAKAYGDYLIVAISSDEFNALKHKQAYYTFEQRKVILEAIRYVDEVIPEHNWEQKAEDINKHDVDVFVMGDDWRGEFDFLKDSCEVVYLPRTVGISTTKIKSDLNMTNDV